MKKISAVLLFLLGAVPGFGHFQMILPSAAIVEDQDSAAITLDLVFGHPFEGTLMDMVRPVRFGVAIGGEPPVDLRSAIVAAKWEGCTTWSCAYTLKQPGDHVFFVEPKPYWEPAEGKFIVHHAKTVVHGFGLQHGWDRELGLETEIIPLTRPYGLYRGNVFAGLVKLNGRPAPFTEVEVEYYNRGHECTAPKEAHITQVVKTDGQGIFVYALPRPGWWGFAALSERAEQMTNPQDKKSYPVEIGAVLWVRAEEMR